MNVLLLSQFFSTTRGGGEYVFSLIAKKLVENNHNVWIITNKIKGEEYNVNQNLRFVFVPPTLEYKGGLPPKFSDNVKFTINAVIKGLKIIKKEKIDLIHSNNFSPALAGSILASLSSKPHITTIHDIFSLEGKDYWKKWAKQNNVSRINSWLGPYFEKFMINFKFNCVHTGSNATRGDLIKFGVKKPIYVIPYTIEYVDNVPEKFDQFQFICVGRLVFYKNLQVIIKAIDLVRKKEPNIKLIIVGNGPHKKILEDLIHKLKLEKNVEFKGYVNTKEKQRLIEESNAMLFPSLFEGFGLVILEAFAHHKPIIVSDVKPMSEIVSHGNTGYIVDPYNEEEWSRMIFNFVNNPHESAKMGKNGNEVLKRNYDPDSMFHKIVQMYNDIIKSN